MKARNGSGPSTVPWELQRVLLSVRIYHLLRPAIQKFFDPGQCTSADSLVFQLVE